MPFLGWGQVHELRAAAWSVPRRYAVVDTERDRVLADGYTSSRPELWPGEPFRIRVEAPVENRR